jgi:tRNA A-37 threonylcarbamoyl transferase component Bud32/tetratricopeptide (TPR) repeat protein
MLRPPNTVNTSSPYVPPVDPIAPLRAALRGHYDIEREIGQGAFATVYLARDLKHERKVAVKVLNADPTSDVGELRFIREIRTLARLQHPNILPLHDSGHVEALLYYVMPYVSGDTVRDRIDREKQMSVEAACSIARDVADALAYAHAQGIIHRDIKPENILLSTGHPILADFGIARAIDLAGVRQLTRTGAASPGTPAYMSPEQLMADKELDGRSDTYSLGCVLFEMLTGKPPFAGKEGFVKRFTEPPPKASSLRKDLPGWLDDAIERALQREPRDRFPTAKEFVAALCPPASPNASGLAATPTAIALSATERVQSDPAGLPEFRFPRPRVSRRVLAAGLAGVLVAAFVVFLTPKQFNLRRVFSSAPLLDSSRVVILPLADQGGSHVGGGAAERLYDAFSHWRGLPLVADTKVAQAISDKGGAPSTENEALSLARSLGAGQLVWGHATGQPGRVTVRVHLYDVGTEESRDELRFVDSTSDGSAYALAAVQLLQVQNRPRAAEGGDDLTNNFLAWSAYGRGHVDLKNWDLAGAERDFRAAIEADPAYTPARLWLAQLLEWKPQQADEWREHARRVAIDRNRLTVRDQLVATGLWALGDGRFPAACDAYSRLTKRDSADFVGWYGLGECQSLDSLVVSNVRSPSGWSFRSSYYSAALAYLSALKVDSGVYGIFSTDKLEKLLPIASSRARRGTSSAPTRTDFAAFPSLDASDTVGFVPYPLAAFATLQRNSRMDAALRRNADVFFKFARDWAKRFPSSASAQEALANAFEVRGELGVGSPRTSPVLRAIDSAIALSRDKREINKLQARRVRVLFKRADFAGARLLADSLLRAGATDASAGDDLAWVAALTGRANLTSQYWLSGLSTKQLSGEVVPPSVAKSASDFFAFAALGVCGAPLASAIARLDSALRNNVDNDIRAAVAADVAGRASSMASPCTHGESALRITTPTDWLQKAQQAFARNQQSKTRAFLDESSAVRGNRKPGDMSPDYTFQGAWLRAQIGDTVAAAGQLDDELGALPTFSSALFSDVVVAAAFPRAMALRSEIAAKRGETSIARRWALALDALWGSADPALRSLADRTKLGAGIGRRP